MRVGHNRGMAIVVIVAGVSSLGLGLLAGTMPSVVAGILCTLVGVLYAVNPMAVVRDGALEVRTPFGTTLRRVDYGHPRNLVVRGGRVLVRCGTTERTTGVGGMMVNRADLDALARWVSNG
jgi:hypothetical protein